MNDPEIHEGENYYLLLMGLGDSYVEIQIIESMLENLTIHGG